MNWLYIGLGGFIGACLRYGLARLVTAWLPQARFPWATLSANLAGCFAIGWLASWLVAKGQASSPLGLFLLVGLLGGFTTYSSFAHELVQLGRQGSLVTAFSSAAVHLVLGVLAVVAGMACSR